MTIYTDNGLRTPFSDLLGCDLPVLLAGMGVVTRWKLAVAARVAEAAGADVVIARGIEAGGHVHVRVDRFALAKAVLARASLGPCPGAAERKRKVEP